MTRVDLEKFDLKNLPLGQSRSFEVRNHTTHFGEWHCFYRSEDGELFHMVTHQIRDSLVLRNQWLGAKNRNAFVKKHLPNTFEPHKTCLCILCTEARQEVIK